MTVRAFSALIRGLQYTRKRDIYSPETALRSESAYCEIRNDSLATPDPLAVWALGHWSSESLDTR